MSWLIELPTDGLSIVSNLVTIGGSIQPQQEFRLVGTVRYIGPGNEARREDIDVVLRYANIESAPPLATGRIGPARANGHSMATVNPARCGREREGCGPCPIGPCGPQSCVGFPICR